MAIVTRMLAVAAVFAASPAWADSSSWWSLAEDDGVYDRCVSGAQVDTPPLATPAALYQFAMEEGWSPKINDLGTAVVVRFFDHGHDDAITFWRSEAACLVVANENRRQADAAHEAMDKELEKYR